MKTTQAFLLAFLTFTLFTFSGCEVIEGIFKAGVIVGVIVVVGIIMLVGFIFSKFRK